MLTERLKKWNEGNIQELLRGCQDIQKKLKSSKKRTTEDITRIFSKLIMEGKISSALKFLDENADNAVLQSNEKVVYKLKDLHPTPAEIHDNSLLHGPVTKPSNYVFNSINEEEILKATKQV